METLCIYNTKIQRNWAYSRSGLALESLGSEKWPRRRMLWGCSEKLKPNVTVWEMEQQRLTLIIKMTPITPTIRRLHGLSRNWEDLWAGQGTQHLWLWASKRVRRSRPSFIRCLRKSTRKVALLHFCKLTVETDECIRLLSAISAMQWIWKKALN